MARSVVAGALALLALFAVAGAGAHEARGVRQLYLQPLSGRSPFPGSCTRNNPLFTPGSAVEPTVAVNPRNPRNIVAAWIQDDGSTILVAASRNGGRNWSRVLVPGLTACTGGAFPVAADPWISFGPRGKTYLAAGLGAFTRTGAVTAQAVARSGDGGFSWTPPTYPQPRTGAYWDKQIVAADPRRAGRAYSVYFQRIGAAGGTLQLATTSNGGGRWSRPRQIYNPGRNARPEPGGSLVLPNGRLIEAVLLLRQGGKPGTVTVLRSRNRGRTWKRARLGNAGNRFPRDPRTGSLVQIPPGLPSLAVAPDRSLYVTWADQITPTLSRVIVARSTNGGKTWARRNAVPLAHAQAYLPSIAVAADGTVGVTYYRSSDRSRAGGKWPTQVHFAWSRNRGRSWRNKRLARTFNIRTAERPGGGVGLRIADYCGLAGLQHGFAAVFVMTKPPARNRPQNVFFERIQLPH